MQLYEFQIKHYLAAMGIPVPAGKTASSPDEVHEIVSKLGGPVVLRPQSLLAYNFETGGIFRAETPEQARHKAKEIFAQQSSNLIFKKVLVESFVEVVEKIELRLHYDWHIGKPVITATGNIRDGFEPERWSRASEKMIINEHVNPFLGLLAYQARNLASGVNLPYGLWEMFTYIATALYTFFHQQDMLDIEINPLAMTKNGELMVLGVRAEIDDNALYRHPEVIEKVE